MAQKVKFHRNQDVCSISEMAMLDICYEASCLGRSKTLTEVSGVMMLSSPMHHNLIHDRMSTLIRGAALPTIPLPT